MSTKDNRKTILTGSIILGILYVLPIILANRYYHDDVPQILYLSPVWIKDGRPLTDLLIRLLCGANNYIYDIFPLPLILAVVIMMSVSAKWSEKFYDIDGVAGVIVTFFPLSMGFFLSNLSYRFDCIGYVMAISLAMLPFLIETTVRWKKYVLNIACALASMCFYQAMIGTYIGLVVVVMFIRLIRDEKPFEDVIVRALSSVTAALVYKFAIAPVIVDNTGWRANSGNLASGTSVIAVMTGNIRDIVMLIAEYFRSVGLRQVLVYILVFVLGLTATYRILEKSSKKHRIYTLLSYCALLPVVFIASVLPMSVLDHSSAQPNHVPEIITLMFVLATGLVLIYKKWPKAALALGLLIVLFRFSFSYAYGNILRLQKEYADLTAQNIVRDIEELDSDSIDEIVIEGKMPYSPTAKSLFELMPILRQMVPSGIDNDGMLNGALINHYYPHLLNFPDTDDDARRHLEDAGTPAVHNRVYDLYPENTRVYVRFR